MNRISEQKNTLKFILLVVFSILFIFSETKASMVSINAPKSTTVGERIAVDVLVDPRGESINSVESTIKFDNDLFKFNGFSVKQSSIAIWVEQPTEKVKGSIYFSGVIPGGIDRLYDPMDTGNKSIPIVRLFFISKSSGDANFIIGKSQVLENDGKGTATTISTQDAKVTVSNNPQKNNTDSLLADTSAPSPFTINIVERSVFGKTPRLATFIAEDNTGGIEHYEVAVGNLGFHKVTSPFALPFRLFPYTLTARAYDYSGNFREQQILIGGEKPYGFGVILVLFLVCLLGYRFYRRVKKV